MVISAPTTASQTRGTACQTFLLDQPVSSVDVLRWYTAIPEFSKPLMSATFTLHPVFYYCVARTRVMIACQHRI